MSKEVKIIRFNDVKWITGEVGWKVKALVSKEVSGSRKIRMLWVHYDPAGKHTWQSHNYEEALIVIRGKINFYYKQEEKEKKVELKEGDAVVVPRSSEHQLENAEVEPAIMIVGKPLVS